MDQQYYDLLEYLQKTRNIYDLFAICYWYSCEYADREKGDDIPDFIMDDVEGILFLYYERPKCGMAVEELANNVEQMIKEKYPYCYDICRCILHWIDEWIETDLTFDGIDDERIFDYCALNHILCDYVKIIPSIYNDSLVGRFGSIKDDANRPYLRDRVTSRPSSIKNNIKEYIIIDGNELKEYEFHIHRVNPNYSVVKRMLRDRKMRIGVFPFSDQDIRYYFDLNYSRRWDERYFSVENVKDSMKLELRSRFEKIMERCKAQPYRGCDFIIFPEMFMTEEILSEIIRQNHLNSFLIAGSVWKDGRNTTNIQFGKNGELFRYHKKIPFIMHDEQEFAYNEDLVSFNPPYQFDLIEIEEIGRIGVCICKDLTWDRTFQFHSLLETGFLFVPMYSLSREIEVYARKFSEELKCIVVGANACAAPDKEGNVGFILLPAKRGTISDHYIEKYYGDCRKYCKNDCSGKYIEIDFTAIHREKDTLTMNISIDSAGQNGEDTQHEF